MDFMKDKKLLILDMNKTFMFDVDRFGHDEDYSNYYFSIGGKLAKDDVNKIINKTFKYLEKRYFDENYFEKFPSLTEAIMNSLDEKDISDDELQKLIDTFSYHERGFISKDYINILEKLSENFTLALISDIWAPSHFWKELFESLDITKFFENLFFSSDKGIVKPSPIPFYDTLEKLNFDPEESIMIGDSIGRDLDGAKRAGIDCIIVGKDFCNEAIACYKDLIEFTNELFE
jgi:FMN phosphatase YigB (HAD superfamily)